MNINSAKEIINSPDKFIKTNSDEFMISNLNSKIEHYSREHILLLKKIYDLSADSIKFRKNFKSQPGIECLLESIKYDIIQEYINNNHILNICLHDLLDKHFIYSDKSGEYRISDLGIYLIENILN